MPIPTTRNIQWDKMRLEYNGWKNQQAQGMDGGWGQIHIDEWKLKPSVSADDVPTHFAINNATPYDPDAGGATFQEWALAEGRRDFDDGPGAYGKTIMVEFEAYGTANRARLSYSLEFKDFGIEWDIPEVDMTTDRG